ncbi:MAG: hypothetical protein HYT39_02695 [Candidatus Sungbacteria bacterium]|nr:hypothetical protein [Candidatus Sungbacteria bacterium]
MRRCNRVFESIEAKTSEEDDMNVMVSNPKLPTRAGKARIEWVPYEKRLAPARQKDIITLPLYPEARIDLTFFGGTDEEPFLVRLNGSVRDAFNKGGEKGFFEALRPPHIRRLENLLGKKAKRQGDIFAFPVSSSWKEVARMSVILSNLPEFKDPDEVKDQSVFGTRHQLNGHGTRIRISEGQTHMFAEGILRAPDHADLELKGVHLLEQTAYLHDPTLAD